MTRAAAFVLSGIVGFAASAQPIKVALEPKPEPEIIVCHTGEGPVIQMVICLDTSGSMEGLITQAKTRLWNVVSTLDSARMKGEKPRLEVAIIQYGSDLQSSSEGFMSVVLPFTSDLDRISEVLYSLQINGSAEYCGMAVDRATRELAWRPTGEGVMKVIVIAGNEPFTQGHVDYRQSVPTAVEYGITVNTVHCGDDASGRSGEWAEAARLGRGEYSVIDQNRTFIHIDCPQDVRLRELNLELNGTYLYYGAAGRDSRMRQVQQDTLNEAAGAPAALARISAKSSASYTNAHWDLVDASKEKGFDYKDLDRKTLPEELQKLSLAEVQKRVEAAGAKRAQVQSEIASLSKDREVWLAAELAKRGEQNEGGLDSALAGLLVSQAERAGFEFEKE